MMNPVTVHQRRCIYVVVTRTGTNVAKAIRVVTKMPYSHASLAADANLTELYSFRRKYSSFPLPATFGIECIGRGVFGKFSQIPCEIYEIPVSELQYACFLQLIDHFQACQKQYSYSLVGLLKVKMQIESELKKKFVCSQFVAYVLHECGIRLDKAPSLYSPEDLRHLPQAGLIYTGELNSYFYAQNSQSRNSLIYSAV